MGAQSAIPLRFPTDDPRKLKTDLERQALELERYHAGLTGPQANAVLVRKPVKRTINDTKAAFGEFTPVSLADAAAELRVSLPRPDPRNAGLTAYIVRRSTLGTVRVSSPGATVNGFDAVELAAAGGLYEFFFDGENYVTPPGTVWGVP